METLLIEEFMHLLLSSTKYSSSLTIQRIYPERHNEIHRVGRAGMLSYRVNDDNVVAHDLFPECRLVVTHTLQPAENNKFNSEIQILWRNTSCRD